MIKVSVACDGNDVMDSVDDGGCTLEEASLVVYRLEQIIQRFVDKDFETKYYEERE